MDADAGSTRPGAGAGTPPAPGWTAMGPGRWAPTRDGRVLHHVVLGEGSPAVVFEAGMGASRSSWGLVAPVIAERTTAVVYDRAGLGRSPRDPESRTLERMSDDLADLLGHLDAGPAVLVAHSYGGPIVRSLAARRPELVGGLVLVDQTDEGCDLYFGGRAMQGQRAVVAALPWLARLRVERVVLARAGRNLPTGIRAESVEEDSTVEAAVAFGREMEPMEADLLRLRDGPLPLPDIPVTLVSGTAPSRIGGSIREALVESHRRRAAALPRGRHVEARRSGHLVPLSEPQVVVDAIVDVIDALGRPG